MRKRPPPRPHPLVLAAGALVLALMPSVARADAASDAKDLFSRGRELRTAGDCPGALVAFRKAYEIYPAGLGSLRNIAECEESLGHFASARRGWQELKRALLTNNESKYDGWSADADQGAARLASKVATLTVDIDAVTPARQPVSTEGLETTLNGEPLASGLVGTPLDRDPGKYVVRVAGPRLATPAEQTVDLAPGDAKRIVMQVVILAQPERAPAPAPASANDMKRTAAWVAFGVGATGFAGVVVSAIVRQGALDDLKDMGCTGDGDSRMCPPGTPYQPVKDRGDTATTLVNVFGAVAIVGAATGAVLLATSLVHGARTAVVISPTGISALGTF